MITTILIPEYRHPNFLEVCLESLIKNSIYKHDILVVCGNPKEAANDFRYDKNTRQRYQKYRSVEEFFNKRKQWLEDNNVMLFDITERRTKFKQEYEKSGRTYWDETDISFNNNIGIEQINTKWFFWNWDDDFIATPDWDINLFKYVDESRHDRVYVPTHLQSYFGNLPEIAAIDPKNSWTTSLHIAQNRPTIPITSRTTDYLLESEMLEFIKNNARHDKVEELCSIRTKMHWVPMLIEKSLYQSMGGNVYKGSGYDIDFDDRLGKAGIVKIMSRDSFIVHRGYLIWDVTGEL